MKERILIKQNVFTCVMFGAILSFVVYQSIFCSKDMSVLAFIIAVPTFLLSILKLIVDILEDLNDRITSYLQQIEKLDYYDCELLKSIREKDNGDISNIFDDYFAKTPDNAWKTEELGSYHNARITRKRIRKIRRGVLYVYYLIFMIMFVLLLLHSELSIWIRNSIGRAIDLNLFTIWSLIIVLLEIMMKSIFEDILFLCLEKKTGIDLQWY